MPPDPDEELITRLARAWRACKLAEWTSASTHGPQVERLRAHGEGICDGLALAIAVAAGSPDRIGVQDGVRFGAGIARARLEQETPERA